MSDLLGTGGMREAVRFADVYEAEIAAGFLRAQGFAAMVADHGVATVKPLLQTALGGIRVLVPAGEAAAAADLLVLARRGDFADADEEAPPEPRAPDAMSLVTAAAALMFADGYAARAYRGRDGRIGLVQRAGFALVAAFVAGTAAAFLLGALFAR